jgi:hypothetical protein
MLVYPAYSWTRHQSFAAVPPTPAILHQPQIPAVDQVETVIRRGAGVSPIFHQPLLLGEVTSQVQHLAFHPV